MKIALIISESHVFIKESLSKIIGENQDVTKYDFSNTPIDEILYEFSSISLFDDQKFVIIEKADDIFSKSYENEDLMKYLQNPSELTTVIFVASKVDKACEFYKYILKNYTVFDNTEKKFNANNLSAAKIYIKNHNSHISDKALDYIKEATLNNYDLMISEIDKLLILGKSNITDELVYNLVPLTPDGNTNRFIDALLMMDEKEALKCIKNMEILNVDLTKMVALIAWNVRVVYLIKQTRKNKKKLEEVLSTYRIPDFKYNKYVRFGNIRSDDELEDILVNLSVLDENIKKYIITKDVVGYHLLNMFCL